MKQIALGIAVHGLPGAAILGAFVAGHAAIAPDLSALETFRADRAAAAETTTETAAADTAVAAGMAAGAALAPTLGAGAQTNPATAMAVGGAALGAATPEATQPQADATTDAAADPTLNLPPVMRYFSFDAPFAGNAGPGSSLFTMELSLTTWQSPLVADLFLAKLAEIQPTLRGLILAELAEVSASDLRNMQTRTEFAARLRDILNLHLSEIGADPAIEAVIVTSFVIT